MKNTTTEEAKILKLNYSFEEYEEILEIALKLYKETKKFPKKELKNQFPKLDKYDFDNLLCDIKEILSDQ